MYNLGMNNKLDIISWFGTIASIVGAFLVANSYFQIGYIAFTFGSASWLFIGIVKKDKPLLILNLVFFLANLNGLYNFFIK